MHVSNFVYDMNAYISINVDRLQLIMSCHVIHSTKYIAALHETNSSQSYLEGGVITEVDARRTQ